MLVVTRKWWYESRSGQLYTHRRQAVMSRSANRLKERSHCIAMCVVDFLDVVQVLPHLQNARPWACHRSFPTRALLLFSRQAATRPFHALNFNPTHTCHSQPATPGFCSVAVWQLHSCSAWKREPPHDLIHPRWRTTSAHRTLCFPTKNRQCLEKFRGRWLWWWR